MPDNPSGDPTMDLFAWRKTKERAAPPQPLTVTQANNQARNLLEQRFGSVTVVGEISNYTRHSSGHHYFSLKDRDAQLSAAFFRREASRLKIKLEAGMEVVVTGKLTIYGKSGRYQIIVERVEPRGAGALQMAFEELKGKLEGEGLFARERKRTLPRVPRRVAVITSPTGAVIRDIVNVSTRRFPRASILLIPAPVQGAGAAAKIASAIARVGRLAPAETIDVLIVGRGGGSLEDLWCFNEEQVARAIAACPIPVVSAVGHETDYTIADFVADCRAPTPSAAAELVFPLRSELTAALGRATQRAARGLHRLIDARRLRLTAARARLGDGRALTREPSQRLGEQQQRLEHLLRRRLDTQRLALRVQEKRLAMRHPRVRLGSLRDRMNAAAQRVNRAARQQPREHRQRLPSPVELAGPLRRRLERERRGMIAVAQRLDALSPLKVLERGYGIVLGPTGAAVTAAGEVTKGDPLNIRVAKGTITATVDSSEEP